ncbi:hypothetical protein [Sphingomonas crocodyli]|uniref:UrcA family protein n=1 Tax=Sphingomonas crocodyli TaxID=1979270 RepID=A0A437M450_9SPHN|nr:hypothetical protein [Sphingomonas crocodyli]RVT92480.1 hypothetical protein EOD43_00660 [Sphingomonas crocodyli]
MKIRTIAYLIALSLSAPALAKADCAAARMQYNAAVREMQTAMNVYVACLAEGSDTYDCGAEFKKIEAAHRMISAAVGQLSTNCVRVD